MFAPARRRAELPASPPTEWPDPVGVRQEGDGAALDTPEPWTTWQVVVIALVGLLAGVAIGVALGLGLAGARGDGGLLAALVVPAATTPASAPPLRTG